MKKISLLLLLIFSLTALANQDTRHEASTDREKASHTGRYNLPNRDPGDYQSPINILTFETTKSKPYKLEFDLQEQINEVENLEHTIQLDFKPGSTIALGQDVYMFKQMHFHTPSEHLIDGVTFPMELHIVATHEKKGVPHYLVFAILFKMGQENAFINEFLDLIPHNHGKTLVKDTRKIGLNELLKSSDIKQHYHYKGSLTTPPYTETVNWFVLKKVFLASQEQIKTINAIEGDNARHIEAKDDRMVEEN